jgi:hypothetical protein
LPLPAAGESQKQGAAMAMAIAKVLSLRGKWDFVVFFFFNYYYYYYFLFWDLVEHCLPRDVVEFKWRMMRPLRYTHYNLGNSINKLFSYFLEFKTENKAIIILFLMMSKNNLAS